MSELALGWRQYRLERKMFWRNPSAAFFNFVLPLLFLVLFGTIFSGHQKDLNIIIPGIAGMNVMATTFNALGMNLTFLREQGVLKRMRGTPLSSGAFLGGVLGSAVVNAVFQVAIVVVAGAAVFGLPWPHDWGELVVFTVLGVTTFAALGVAFSHVIPNFDSAPAYTNFVFLPSIFIGGVFFDPAHSTKVLTDIARVLPISHLVEGMRGAIVSGSGLGHHVGDLAVIALWGAAGLWFAVRGFSWEQKRS
ncbi:MAG TPA: ABC transporter permease [Solirubrobacteraceae bacterium]|nr:ABC transporter permease [Solirubrobacteraceae bacterium]